jgi:hypothetical protein
VSAEEGPQGLPGLLAWLRALAFTLALTLLVAWGIGDEGRAMPAALVCAAGLGLGALYWLFPRGVHFAFGTATGLVLYGSLFVVLGGAQFPDAPEWSRPVAFLMPVLAFLGMAWWRRHALTEIAERQAAQDLDHLPHTARWLAFAGLVGLVCFVLPVNRLLPGAQAAALLIAMAAIAAMVAIAARDVVRLLVDVALIVREITGRTSHLVVPATAFLMFYALLVVAFAATYRIADGLSVQPLFEGAEGPIRVTYSDALHFSVATLSTVGYGDIKPLDDGVRVLASLEVVAGQLLLLFGFAEIMRARRGRGVDPDDEDVGEQSGQDGRQEGGREK